MEKTDIVFKPHCHRCGYELKQVKYIAETETENDGRCSRILPSVFEPVRCPNCGAKFAGYIIPISPTSCSISYDYENYKPSLTDK